MSKSAQCVVLKMTFGRCASCGECADGLHGVKELPDGKLNCFCGSCCPECRIGGEASRGTVSIARCREELEHLSKLYQEGHPDKKGLKVAMSDWILEEVALLRSCKA